MNSKLKHKRSLSLIEVIVCLGLVTVLVSSLFFWYRSTTKQKEELAHLKGPLLEERYAHQRLQNLFPKMEKPFFTTNQGLVFIFDRGNYVDPRLSGRVLGRLYRDDAAKCLCLAIWPYPQAENPATHPSQTFVLLDGVESCQFEFYSPPDLFQKVVDPEKVGQPRPREGWQDVWLSDYETLPAFVKLTIKRKREMEYCFDLPSNILYPKENAA